MLKKYHSLRPLPLYIAVLAACVLYAADRAVARRPDEMTQRFNKAKRVIAHQIKSKRPAERVAGVQKLAEYPVKGAVEMLLQLGCNSNDPAVGKAAYDVLLTLNDRQGICEYLVETLKAALGRGSINPGTCATLTSLMHCELPPIRQQIDELLTYASVPIGAGQPLLVTVVDNLTTEGGETGLKQVLRISQTPAVDNLFGVRRAVIQSLAQSNRPEAIEALLGMLDRVRGEARADIVRYLIRLSGRQRAMTSADWRSWWNAKKDSFRAGTATASMSEPVEIPNGTDSYYYGLPIYGERVVFVIDTSDSMYGQRLAAAKAELLTAIAGLPEGAAFNVLTFNGGVYAWSPVLVPANLANRLQAGAFVAAQKTAFKTFSYEALQAALGFDTEAIYFVTDGEPFGGMITNTGQIVETVSRLNRSRRVTINCVGVATNSVGNRFLKDLADRNWGSFRRID